LNFNISLARIINCAIISFYTNLLLYFTFRICQLYRGIDLPNVALLGLNENIERIYVSMKAFVYGEHRLPVYFRAFCLKCSFVVVVFNVAVLIPKAQTIQA
jgi:hypothetical protein